MQTPTHMVAGVLIQKSIPGKNRKLTLAIVAIVAFLSHGFLDKLAQITYHPANPDFHSVFWVTYHSILLVTAIIFGVIFWRKYKWGIIFANLPDVDWIFIHGQEIFHCKIPFYRQPHMHHFLGYIYDHIPPFSYVTHWINQLPNERHNSWACLCEVALVALMFVAIWLLNLLRSYQPAGRAGESKKTSTSTPT
jgi:hypothetical protein